MKRGMFIVWGIVAVLTSRAQQGNDLDLPRVVLKKDIPFTFGEPNFHHSVGGRKIKERTKVTMEYDDTYLTISFECLDDPYVGHNRITEDNKMLAAQEAFEIFISKGPSASEQYLEIQINPNGAVFFGRVTYRYKTDRDYKCEKIDPEVSGIVRKVTKDIGNNKWSGDLKLPLKLLDYPANESGNVYRFNLYRIIQNHKPKGEQWRCTFDSATFACWNSTMAQIPQFHVPDRFGILVLN